MLNILSLLPSVIQTLHFVLESASLKEIKQNKPQDGWAQVNAILRSHARPAVTPTQPEQQHPAVPDNVPTLTETPDSAPNINTTPILDPLIHELFEQLDVSPNDDLTKIWRTIADEVNVLSERMASQRELKERLENLDHELLKLRGTIVSRLAEAQHVSNQQLRSARLRAEVSALAHTKLSAKLKT